MTAWELYLDAYGRGVTESWTCEHCLAENVGRFARCFSCEQPISARAECPLLPEVSEAYDTGSCFVEELPDFSGVYETDDDCPYT
jgi:hypothetical protein